MHSINLKTCIMMTVLKDSRKRALAADAITAPVTVVAFLSSMLELGLFDFDILV
jgi:hypothetical protein